MTEAQKPWEQQYDSGATDAGAEPWKQNYGAARDAKPSEPPARGFKGWAQDVAATAVKGAIGVPEAIVGVADIPTGGRVGKFLENEGGSVGFRPKQAKEIVNEWHSDATKEAQRKFQEADGFVDKAAVALQNPSLIATAVGESLPAMGLGGVAARGLMATTRLGQAGAAAAARGATAAEQAAAAQKAATIAGAAGEGLTMAGSAAEQIRQETQDGLLTPTQSGLAAATGLVGGAFGYAGGKLANRLGIGDADTMFAQGSKGMAKQAADDAAVAATNPLAQQAAKSIPRQVIEGAITEGFLEELPQSMSEQILQNLALGKPWSEDLDSAAVMGILSGGAMGAGAAGFRGFREAGGKPGSPTPADASQPQTTSKPNPGLARVSDEFAARLQALQEQEQGEAQVPQSTPPDGAAVLAQQNAQAQAARDAEIAANRAMETPDDEIFQSTGANTQRPSEAMGLRTGPEAGPLENAAALSVDSGLSEQMQGAAALANTQTSQPGGQGDAQQPVTLASATAAVQPQPQEPAAERPTLTPQERERLASSLAGSDLSKASIEGANAQELQIKLDEVKRRAAENGSWNVPLMAQRRRIEDAMARLPATNSPLISEQQALQAELAAEQQGNVPRADRADRAFQAVTDAAQTLPATQPGAVEAAGPATIPATTGVARESQASQTQQGSTQPTQAGGPQAGPTAAPATASTSPAGGNRVQAAGLTDGTPTQNLGAQAAPAAGAQGAAQGNASWAALTPEQRRRARLEHEIATGMTNNGGVMAKLRPSAIEKRKQELAAMGDAGKLPSPGPAEPLSADGLAAQSQPAPATHADPGEKAEAAPAVKALPAGNAAQNQVQAPAAPQQTPTWATMPAEDRQQAAQAAGLNPVQTAKALKAGSIEEMPAEVATKLAPVLSSAAGSQAQPERAQDVALSNEGELANAADTPADQFGVMALPEQIKEYLLKPSVTMRQDGKTISAKDYIDGLLADGYGNPEYFSAPKGSQAGFLSKPGKPKVTLNDKQMLYADAAFMAKKGKSGSKPNQPPATAQQAQAATEQQAASATHKDPGQTPEAATPAVVAESLQKAARNEDTKPSEMRKWLLAEIDKELLQAPDRADYDEAVKRWGEKDAISGYTGNGPLGKNSETGFITFDVPGDGKYKVRNSVRGLLEFRKNVMASSGFKDSGQKQVKPAQNDGVQGGSSGSMAAINNMIEEGDFEAARDYAEAVGIKLEDVKVPRGDMKPAWEKYLKDGTLPPAPDTRPKPAPKTAAQLDEEKQQAAPVETNDTGWTSGGTVAGGRMSRIRTIKTDDGRTIVARLFEWAGRYEDGEVNEGSKLLLRLNDSNRAQERIDAFLDRLVGKTTALDLMGFKMEPIDDDGGFRLQDGNMIVTVERTDTGLQARHRSAKSSPSLTDQQAVEWAANIRDESRKSNDGDKPTIPAGYKPAGEPFYRGGKLIQGYAPFAPGERVTMKESAGQSGVVESLTSPDDAGVFSGAMVKFDNGSTQIVKFDKLEAEAKAAPATGPRRDPTKVSMFHPYEDGDIVTIDGQDWTVKQDTPGWYLTNTGNWRGTHPTIRNIKAMADLIREVEREATSQPITRADVEAAQQQAAAIIGARIDAMTAGEVNTIAKKFLPTMGVKPTVSKERNKAAVTDFTKVNPMAAADEFGVTLPADVRRALDAEMHGKVVDGAQDDGVTKEMGQAQTDSKAPAEPNPIDFTTISDQIAAAKRRLSSAKDDATRAAIEKEIRELRRRALDEDPIDPSKPKLEEQKRKVIGKDEFDAMAAKHGYQYARGYRSQQQGWGMLTPIDVRKKAEKDAWERGWLAAKREDDSGKVDLVTYGDKNAPKTAPSDAQTESQAPAEPNPLEHTPKQYADAWLRWSAETNGLPLAEVREMQGDEAGLKAIEQRWVDAVVQEAKSGQPLPTKTLDKLLEVRPNTQLPESAIPDGYQRPEARKAEKEEAAARKAKPPAAPTPAKAQETPAKASGKTKLSANQDIRRSFAGQQAATADTMALATAQQRLEAGEDAETVRQETGWFKGNDGKWRFEIDDSRAFLKGTGTFGDVVMARMAALEQGGLRNAGDPVRLGDVLRHESLFAAYPALRDIEVQFTPRGVRAKGRMLRATVNGKSNSTTIQIGADLSSDEALNVLLHEVQHGIQHIEGFATGGTPSDFAKDLPDGSYDNGFDTYNRTAGEVEARNTQARQKLTSDQRRATAPGSTADVADADVIVVFNGKEMANAPMPANAAHDATQAAQPLRTPAATIRAAITKAYGKLLGQLESKGLVTLTQTEDEAIEAAAQARADKTGGDVVQIKRSLTTAMQGGTDLDVKRSANGAVQGFFDPQTGQSFLIADNLTAESAPGVLMHEVGIHMAADGSMKALFNRAAMMLKLQKGNPFIKAVQARMDAAGETSGEEAAAYIAEAYENDRANAPASVQRWLADLLAAVKAWMFKKGIMGADRLTVADIAAVARANARSMARDGGANEAAPAMQRGGVEDDVAFSRSRLADLKASALDQITQTLSHPGKVSLWDKTVGTMRNLAERNPAFKPVFESAQRFIDDVSMLANDAANVAPRLLPRVENLGDLTKKPITAADNKAVAKPLFEGTLMWARDTDGTPMTTEALSDKYRKEPAEKKAQIMLRTGKLDDRVLKMWQGLPVDQFEKLINSKFDSTILKPGVVWSTKELQTLFGLNDKQVGLYKEARVAIDRSIDMTARADMLRAMGEEYASMRDVVLEQSSLKDAFGLMVDMLQEDARANPDAADRLLQINNALVSRYESATELMDNGYAPLSRFGKYTLDVVDKDGERQYFGMFESKREANLMKLKMASVFPGATITQGTMSEQAFKLFQGITPESLEQFGGMLGLSSTGDEAKDKAFQAYLQLAKNNHSALKRLIHRKGIDGYSEDVGRVLASFVYSNARLGAGGLNAGTMEKAIEGIPKEQGELRDVAMGLRSYIQDPQEEGQAIRGMLFAQYLGGSVASAMVNMTQPFQITMPWLSQYGGMGQAAKQMARALKDMATKGKQYEDDLAKALKDAEDDGTVSPQEIHQLMAQARGTGSLRTGDGTKLGDARAAAANNWERVKVAWGQPFALAEQFNRRSTFIAAYRIAKAQGMADPAEFARKAVLETQFLYSKANKMRWGRGAIGGTLMTFKTYSVSYLELMHRMWNQGEAGSPERAAGRRAVGWAVAMLLLMGGAGGLPFMEDAEDLIDGAGQLMGYNVSAKQWRKELLRDVLGKELAGFVEHGISGLPGAPVDVSGRLGMGNLIPGTGLLLTKQNRERDLLEVAGPAGDLISRGFTGARKAITGDVAGAAMEFSPAAVRNAAKGIDMATSGIYKDTKGYKVIDTTLDEAISKAIGFQPKSVAEVQESNSFMQRSKSFYIQTSSDIKAQWAKALFEKDDAALERVRERLERWNTNNPDQRIVVKMPDVWKRVREMGKDRTQRIADTAPKALREQMRSMAREAG